VLIVDMLFSSGLTKKRPSRIKPPGWTAINLLFHPDFTVAIGIAPIHALRLAGYTAGGDFHPALRFYLYLL
jgi:hypothetical protein